MMADQTNLPFITTEGATPRVRHVSPLAQNGERAFMIYVT